MLGHLESYQDDKAKTEKVQKEIGKSSSSIHNDTQNQIPKQKSHPREEFATLVHLI